MFGYKFFKEDKIDELKLSINSLNKVIECKDFEIDNLNVDLTVLKSKCSELQNIIDTLNSKITSYEETQKKTKENTKAKTTRRRKVTKKTNNE